jgi:hypothetical protein
VIEGSEVVSIAPTPGANFCLREANAVLALAEFGARVLPPFLTENPLEYFATAPIWLRGSS